MNLSRRHLPGCYCCLATNGPAPCRMTTWVSDAYCGCNRQCSGASYHTVGKSDLSSRRISRRLSYTWKFSCDGANYGLLYLETIVLLQFGSHDHIKIGVNHVIVILLTCIPFCRSRVCLTSLSLTFIKLPAHVIVNALHRSSQTIHYDATRYRIRLYLQTPLNETFNYYVDDYNIGEPFSWFLLEENIHVRR